MVLTLLHIYEHIKYVFMFYTMFRNQLTIVCDEYFGSETQRRDIYSPLPQKLRQQSLNN